MPIIKSAKKRVRQIEKSTIRNAKTKRTLRESIKAFTKALTDGKKDEIVKAQNEVNSAIDIAAKKNILHKNKAARRKAQINAQAKAVVADGKVVKKAPVKKPTAVKTGAKKAAAKKATVKKATAAKTGAKKAAPTTTKTAAKTTKKTPAKTTKK